MCGYHGDYLKEAPPGTSSKKLLHWSAKDVVNWIRSIELDDYVTGLEEAGIHGALMVWPLSHPLFLFLSLSLSGFKASSLVSFLD